MGRHQMLTGFVLGLSTTWLYHHFVKPLPGGGAKGSLSGSK